MFLKIGMIFGLFPISIKLDSFCLKAKFFWSPSYIYIGKKEYTHTLSLSLSLSLSK